MCRLSGRSGRSQLSHQHIPGMGRLMCNNQLLNQRPVTIAHRRFQYPHTEEERLSRILSYLGREAGANLDHAGEARACTAPMIQIKRLGEQLPAARLRPMAVQAHPPPAGPPGQKRRRAGGRVEVHLDIVFALLQRLPDRFEDQQVAIQKLIILEDRRQVPQVAVALITARQALRKRWYHYRSGWTHKCRFFRRLRRRRRRRRGDDIFVLIAVRLFRLRGLEDKCEWPNVDSYAGRDQTWLVWQQALSVYKCPIRAPQVGDNQPLRIDHELGMAARHKLMIELKPGIGVAPDQNLLTA